MNWNFSNMFEFMSPYDIFKEQWSPLEDDRGPVYYLENWQNKGANSWACSSPMSHTSAWLSGRWRASLHQGTQRTGAAPAVPQAASASAAEAARYTLCPLQPCQRDSTGVWVLANLQEIQTDEKTSICTSRTQPAKLTVWNSTGPMA